MDEGSEAGLPAAIPVDTKSKSPRISRRRFLQLSAGVASVVLGEFSADTVLRIIRSLTPVQTTEPLAGAISQIQTTYPEVEHFSSPESWSKAIKENCEAAKLPLTQENLAIILTIIRTESGFRAIPRAFDMSPSPTEQDIAFIHKPNTSGPMEVNVRYVMDTEHLSYDQAMARINSTEGGLKYGIRFLKKIIDQYQDVANSENKLLCIFADWNSGPGHSRLAGFQVALNKATDSSIRPTGYLLAENPQHILSSTQKALAKLNLGLSAAQVLADFTQGESDQTSFKDTQTYQAVVARLGPIEPTPADAPVLGVVGVLKKLLTNIDSSAEYAQARLKEYREISQMITSGANSPPVSIP